MSPRLPLLIAAMLVSLLLGSCDDHRNSRTYHCKDGTLIMGPGARPSSCDDHGGLG